MAAQAIQHRPAAHPIGIAPMKVCGVTLDVPPAIRLSNCKFDFSNYLSMSTVSGVGITAFAGCNTAIIKSPSGELWGYAFDVVSGWQKFSAPLPSKLPKLGVIERVKLFTASTPATWVEYKHLPNFADRIKFDAAGGTVSFLDVVGLPKTVKLADHINETFVVTLDGKITGEWLLVVLGPDRANIYRTDEELGYVERIRIAHRRTYRHALLEPVPHNAAELGEFMFHSGGFIVPTGGAIPLKLDVRKRWKIHLASNMTLESFGDGNLVQLLDSQFTEYFYDFKRGRFFEMDLGWRDRVAPWVLDNRNPGASVQVCGGAVTLYGSGTAKVFDDLILPGECFDAYAPNGAHAFRKPGSDWIFVVEGVKFQCGIFVANAFRDKDGSTSDGWGWGSETQLPTGRAISPIYYFVAAMLAWFLFLAPVFMLKVGIAIGALYYGWKLLRRHQDYFWDAADSFSDFVRDAGKAILRRIGW